MVAVTGTSQGGGITLAVAGLLPDISAAMPDVPFLSDIARGMGLSDNGPDIELVSYLATHRQDEAGGSSKSCHTSMPAFWLGLLPLPLYSRSG